MRIYIAGPMTGIDDMNGEAFHEAQEMLKAEGHVAVNPHRLLQVEGITRERAMKVDIHDILGCDGVYMLEGYEGSPGALLELSVALAVGLEVRYQEDDDGR